MLVADGDLDESLQYLAGTLPCQAPVRLQHLVRLEEEPGVEEQGRGLQGLGQRRRGRRAQRLGGERGDRTPGARDHRAALLRLGGGEPCGHDFRIACQTGQNAPGPGIVQGGQDRLGEAAAHAKVGEGRRRHPTPGEGRRRHPTPEGATGSRGGAGAGIAAPRTTWLPARRSCSARLSRRRPAMAKPRPSVPRETKYPMKRKNAAPMESAAPSMPTTRTPASILPRVCPPTQACRITL